MGFIRKEIVLGVKLVPVLNVLYADIRCLVVLRQKETQEKE